MSAQFATPTIQSTHKEAVLYALLITVLTVQTSTSARPVKMDSCHLPTARPAFPAIALLCLTARPAQWITIVTSVSVIIFPSKGFATFAES